MSSVAAVALSGAAFANNDGQSSGPTVTITDGQAKGYSKNGVNIFLGIPYAAPPVDKLRWQPPQPVKRWKDTLDATHFANTCPQVTELGAFAGPSSTNEDCLYLNVFTTGATKNGKKKPVIVWIHGGGNIDGETNDYDASKLSQGGPDGVASVVVTLNYRLGLFGFFSHPAINKEGHLWGNYGILDQQAALRWVQRNIAAFGGDPNKVALGGQSAGAVDTGANQLSPYANGLFNRAIYQSSPGFFSTLPSADTALTKGKDFATAAGCAGSNAAAANCLRELTPERILQLQGTPNTDGPYTAGLFVDGSIIPLTPQQAFSTGKFNKMPIMGGAVKDELTFQTGITEYFSGIPHTPMTAAQYAAAVTGPAAAQYPLSAYGNDPMLAYERYSTDPNKCRELHVVQLWAPQVPTYAYDFTYQNAPYYFPQMPGFKPLAAHTIDIQFVFNNWHGGNLGVNIDQETGQPRELNQQETKLSDQIVAAWTNFADTGNPNGTGNSPWPKFGTGNGAKYFVQDIPLSTTSIANFRAAYKCDFWDTQLTY
jgi:para-nitrobenzyl esterase